MAIAGTVAPEKTALTSLLAHVPSVGKICLYHIFRSFFFAYTKLKSALIGSKLENITSARHNISDD